MSTMGKPETLEIVFQLIDRFGANAEHIAGDEIEKALQLGDADSFNEWCLIAETIAALNRENRSFDIEQEQIKAKRQRSSPRLPGETGLKLQWKS